MGDFIVKPNMNTPKGRKVLEAGSFISFELFLKFPLWRSSTIRQAL
jgi:hypothetical protein